MKTSEQVENILRASKLARNSDDELHIIYMQKAGMDLSRQQIETYKSLPSFETLTRIRRKLQEHNKYPADPEVERQRFGKYKTMRQTGDTDVLEGYNVKPWGQP